MAALIAILLRCDLDESCRYLHGVQRDDPLPGGGHGPTDDESERQLEAEGHDHSPYSRLSSSLPLGLSVSRNAISWMFSIYTTEGAIFSAKLAKFHVRRFGRLRRRHFGILGSFSARNLRRRPTGIAIP